MPLVQLIPILIIFAIPLILYGLYGYFIRSRLRQRSEVANATGQIRLRNPPPPIMRYFTLYRNIGLLFESRRDYVPVQNEHHRSVALEPQSQPSQQQDERTITSPSPEGDQRATARDPGAVV